MITFEDYMESVNDTFRDFFYGMETSDFPDIDYYACYEQGMNCVDTLEYFLLEYPEYNHIPDEYDSQTIL